MQRLLIVPLLALLFAVCTGFQETPPFTTFENQEYGYRIDIPAGFSMRGEPGKQTSFMFLPGKDDKSDDAVYPIISVIVSEIPSGYSAATLYDTKFKKIQDMIAQKDSPYDDLKALTVAKGSALTYREINKDDSESLNHWYVNIYANRKYYIIDISGTRDQLRKHRSEFDHVMESFTIIP
jgi:hypothetical protein